MSIELSEKHGVRLAVEGCGHGTLNAIYASVAEACNQKNWPGVDLLIIGGDFQSVRNAYDLNCVSMPAKYREMHDFHEYYSGQRKAPYLTIFVGGNHEASNYLFELYYGGWVAEDIYYMGAANVLRLGPLRIAGLSGIWKGYSYRKPHIERLPYNQSDLKSIYHVRELDTRKLLQLRTQVDIGISHDWPKGVERSGDHKELFRAKSHLEEDSRNNQLGSVAARQVLDWLRPRYWFSAHLHIKFAAIVNHEKTSTNGEGSSEPTTSSADKPSKNADEIDLDDDATPNDTTPDAAPDAQPVVPANTDEIDLELEDDTNGLAPVAPGQGLDDVQVPTTTTKTSTDTGVPTLNPEEALAALPASFNRPAPREKPIHPSAISNTTTHFLALDKCEPNRHFLQLQTVTTDSDKEPQRPFKLSYDPEWLAITRAFALHEAPTFGDPKAKVPSVKSQSEYQKLIDEQQTWIDTNLSTTSLEVPENFQQVAPVYDGGDWKVEKYQSIRERPNPQTAQFCKLLQIPNALAISEVDRIGRMAAGPRPDDSFSGDRGRGRGRGGHGRGRGGSGRGGGGGFRGGRGGGRGGGYRGGGRGHGR